MKDRVAIVTGAGSGIGRAIALAYAREGARVVVSDLDETGGRETVERARALGAAAMFSRADVADADDCRRLVEAAESAYGRLDVACNNAGIAGLTLPTADYPVESWNRVLAVNLSGVFFGMKYQIAAMRKAGGGAIVNVASILGAVGFANAPAYTAAKHGVVGLTRSAALEVAAAGIRINAVGPGFIHTPMIGALESDRAMSQALMALHPMGRLGQPEEVAELVLWLGSDKASFVTGSYHAVDGGYLAR